MSSVSKRAALFLGSGISRKSGGATVDEITERLLSGAWKPHSDWRFYPCTRADGLVSIGNAKVAQEFIHLLKRYIDQHLLVRESRRSNYEDIYAAALQILQDETSEIVSPLIQGSVSTIRSQVAALCQNYPAHVDNNPFASLAKDATRLVQWAVFHELSKADKPVGLEVLTTIAKATGALDIFTVNHDLLIEHQLSQDRISVADGFSERDGDVRRFMGLWNSNAPVHLYKLHGSIDWYQFQFNDGDIQFAKVGNDPDHAKDGKGDYLNLRNSDPLFLTGTTGKDRLYGVGLIGEFFSEFHKRLQTHHVLICCGYGWSDKGINNRLNQWLQRDRDNRVIILHNAPLDELKMKRFWQHRWAQYEQGGKLVVVPKWISECDLCNLQPYFED